jgi:hypothetical protein
MDLTYGSVHTNTKKYSTNIPLSGPHARSITSMYVPDLGHSKDEGAYPALDINAEKMPYTS